MLLLAQELNKKAPNAMGMRSNDFIGSWGWTEKNFLRFILSECRVDLLIPHFCGRMLSFPQAPANPPPPHTARTMG
jgi:hypothetical protein